MSHGLLVSDDIARRALMQQLADALRQAERARPREVAAAVAVQSAFRRWSGRRCYLRLWGGVVAIQRVFRGHLGRLVAYRERIAQQKERQSAYYRRQATQIQRVWRGHYSRKWVYDYSQTKAYLVFVRMQNQTQRAADTAYRLTAVESAVAEEHARAERQALRRMDSVRREYKTKTWNKMCPPSADCSAAVIPAASVSTAQFSPVSSTLAVSCNGPVVAETARPAQRSKVDTLANVHADAVRVGVRGLLAGTRSLS